MHNIGRIQLETDTEMENYEAGQLEWLGETVFSEAEEMELAAQLMEVNSEEELDRFLGDLIRKARGAQEMPKAASASSLLDVTGFQVPAQQSNVGKGRDLS